MNISLTKRESVPRAPSNLRHCSWSHSQKNPKPGFYVSNSVRNRCQRTYLSLIKNNFPGVMVRCCVTNKPSSLHSGNKRRRVFVSISPRNKPPIGNVIIFCWCTFWRWRKLRSIASKNHSLWSFVRILRSFADNFRNWEISNLGNLR